MFRSSHFSFWFLVTFGNEVTKIRKYYVLNLRSHFARQDGQDGKKWKENHATRVTKIPKTRRRKYGLYETFVLPSSAVKNTNLNMNSNFFFT